MKLQLVDLLAQHTKLRPELDAAISQVMDSCQFVLGENVKKLEEEVAAVSGARYGLGVNSGTDALLLALAACGIGPGDEVITTPFTFVATAEVVSILGAVPVFADIDINTFNIDVAALASRVTNKTKALLPVHLFGQLADMESLTAIARDHNLRLICDGAQAIGAERAGKPLAAFGDITTLSFYPTKNLGGCGDGGMTLMNNDDLREEIRLRRFHGSGGGYIYKRIGFCSRLDELQAAILRVKARHLHEWTQCRRALAATYDTLLANLAPVLALPKTDAGNLHAYHQYTIRVLEGANKREALQKHLTALGIGTGIFYPLCLHVQDAYAYLGYTHGDMPNAELASTQVLQLPVHPDLTEDQAVFIADAIHQFFD